MKAPRKTWLYFILDANNFSYTWDALALMPVKQSVLKPIFQTQNPKGWKDIEINAATNTKYFSLNRQFATQLKFVNDGANILRWFTYYERGYDNDYYLLITQWNRETGVYETAYKGKIDFTTFTDSVESGVTVDTKEGGILEFLNANDGIVEEIVCDESNEAIVLVEFDGINLEDTFNYQFINTELIDNSDAHVFAAPFVFLNNEGDNIGLIKNDSPFGIYESALDGGDLLTSTSYVLYSIYGITVTITGTLIFNWATDGGDGLPGGVYVVWKTDMGQEFIMFHNATSVLGNPTIVDISITITLAPNEKLFFYIELDDNPSRNFRITPEDSEFNIKFISRNEVTQSYALTWYDWYRQMVLRISNGKCTGDSVFLAARPDLVVTCGDALRNTDRTVIPHYYIASSFADGFKSMSAICDFALQIINGVLFIEPKTVIYASDPATEPKIFELGEIADVTVEIPVELLVNEIACGFPDQQYDERNGKYEFNSEQNWKAPVTLAAQQVLDIRSVWRGDAFGIEFIRATLTKLDTTDNEGDKQAFMIQCVPHAPAPVTSAGAVKSSENNVSGDVAYDSISYVGGGENYISSSFDNTEFTYIYAAPFNVTIYANLYLALSGSGTITVELRLNGTAIASQSFLASVFFQRVDFSISQTLNSGDVITVNISNGGATVDLQSAGLYFEITGARVIPVYTLYRDNYDSITGVLDNTVYNVNFSPHRQILAHKEYLGGLFKQMQMDSLVLSSSKKNVELTTDLGGYVVQEKANIPVSTLQPALFLPYYLRYRCKPQYSFAKTVTAINGGYIKSQLNGNVIYLLPIGEMSAKPALNEVQEWKLLLAPNNILSNLLKLSQAGLYIEYMGNLLFISDLNPVHFVRYDDAPADGYHFQDYYNEWVRKRNVRWVTKRDYVQLWQYTDVIKLQFIVANLGGIEITVKDCDGTTVFEQACDSITDAAVQPPYSLQQCDISGLPVGDYYIIISYQGVPLAISERQRISVDEPAYRYDYSSSYNVLFGYFGQWKPYLRCESIFMQWQPQSDFEDYEDDPGDVELINARTNKFRNLILGTPDGVNGIGLPDFMMNKMNHILVLNQCYIENEHYVRGVESKLEPTQAQGNPFDFYTVQVQKAKNERGLSFTGIDGNPDNGIISYTFDASGFGMNEDILTIEVEDES